MASRLYRTTRPLYLQVCRVLDHLGVAAVGSVTMAILIALYVTGLVLLDARPTQTRVTRVLPGRCHDALNRLLRSMPLSTRTLMALLIGWIRRLGTAGYVCLDDVVVEKAFAERLPWAGWTYSFAKQHKVYGMHVVVLLWCSTDGTWRIPVAFRLWRPKRTCAPHRYQTKLQLAAGMLTEVVAARLPFQYLVMTPTTPPAGSPAWLAGCSSPGGDARPRTTVVWRGRRQQVATLARQLRLGWRPRLGLRAAAVRVYTPTHGMVGLVVTRNRHGNYDYLVTSDPAADLAPVVVRKQAGAGGDHLPGYQAGRRAGCLPVLVGSGDGPPRRPGPGRLRRAATAPP